MVIPRGSRTVSIKSTSATLATTSLLVLKLKASDVGGVCHLRCPEVDVDADVVLPAGVAFTLLFPFEFCVSSEYNITLFHNHAMRVESVAATSERWAGRGLAGGRQKSDCEGDDDDDVSDDSDGFLRAEELAVGCM